MTRAFIVVLDSVGCGGAPDAAAFFNDGLPDSGANTLGHIAEACAGGRATAGRHGPLRLPVLDGLGLGRAVEAASGLRAPGLGAVPQGRWGAATEVSRGKDTPSGHWELAGVPVPWDWTYFPTTEPAFDAPLVDEVCRLAGTGGILGNRHAAGIAIMEALGEEHLRTGWPICYTSADSVFQIAAHEEAFGLERLVLGFEGNRSETAKTRQTQRGIIDSSKPATFACAMHCGDIEAEAVAGRVLAAAAEVFRELGPGLLPSAYEMCLCHELHLRGVPFTRKQPLPLTYKGVALPEPDEVELLVAGRVVVQPRALRQIQPVHEARLLSQLRLGRWPLGLLINFNSLHLAEGIRRLALTSKRTVGVVG